MSTRPMPWRKVKGRGICEDKNKPYLILSCGHQIYVRDGEKKFKARRCYLCSMNDPWDSRSVL